MFRLLVVLTLLLAVFPDTARSVAAEPADKLTIAGFPLDSDRAAELEFRAAPPEGHPLPAGRSEYFARDTSGKYYAALAIEADDSRHAFVSGPAGLFEVNLGGSQQTLKKLPLAMPRSIDPQELSGLRKGKRANETVDVMVMVAAPFQPVGTLSTLAKSNQALVGRLVQQQVLDAVNTGSSIVRRYHSVPALALRVDAAALKHLSRLPQVLTISPVALTQSTAGLGTERVQIGADAAFDSGFSGAGQAIVIMDEGLTSTLPMFAQSEGRILAEACFSQGGCPGGTNTATGAGAAVPCPGCTQHGNAVAGVAAGSKLFRTETRDLSYYGVARGAKLIPIMISYSSGSSVVSSSADQVAALEHTLTLAEQFPIAAVNISQGNSSRNTSACDSSNPAYKLAIDNLISVGIATTISSGNQPWRDGLVFPACLSSAISVGGSETKIGCPNAVCQVVGEGLYELQSLQTNAWEGSAIANFVDLMAPAVDISGLPDINRSSWTGTSFAAPMAAAAFAMLKQKKPSASVSEMLTALRDSGVRLDDTRPARNNVKLLNQGNTLLNLPAGSVTGLRRLKIDAALARIAAAPNRQLTLTVEGTGSVRSDPTGIECPGSCSASFAQGSLIRLQAVPGSDASFLGWSGAADCSDGIVRLNSNLSCTARFGQTPRYGLQVTVNSGNGSGKVTSSPAGIDCGSQCSAVFTEGTVVTLQATPDPFVNFSGFGIDCNSDGQVTMSQNRICSAGFLRPSFSFVIGKSGNGRGTVTGTGGVGTCDENCSVTQTNVLNGSTVSLSATAAVDSEFTGWSDAACAANPITVTGNMNCVANFVSTLLSARDRVFDFEPPGYAGSTAGTALNSQNGFINPNTSISQSAAVFTANGNSLQLPVSASGGSQFAGGSGPGGGFQLRSQIPIAFSSSATTSCSADNQCGVGELCRTGSCVLPVVWDVCYELAAAHRGNPPAPLVVGSLSLLGGGNTLFIAKATWADQATPAAWDALYDVFDSAGSAASASCATGLSNAHWWRWCSRIDLSSNRLLSCTMESLDPSAPSTRRASFTGRYLGGGASAPAGSDALRLFVGGDQTVAGNTLGFDNIKLQAVGIFASGFE